MTFTQAISKLPLALLKVLMMCIITMILAMWYKGDLKPTRLRKLIRKVRNK